MVTIAPCSLHGVTGGAGFFRNYWGTTAKAMAAALRMNPGEFVWRGPPGSYGYMYIGGKPLWPKLHIPFNR